MTKFFVVEHVKNLDAYCAFTFAFLQVLIVWVDKVNRSVDASSSIASTSRDDNILTLIEKEWWTFANCIQLMFKNDIVKAASKLVPVDWRRWSDFKLWSIDEYLTCHHFMSSHVRTRLWSCLLQSGHLEEFVHFLVHVKWLQCLRLSLIYGALLSHLDGLEIPRLAFWTDENAPWEGIEHALEHFLLLLAPLCSQEKLSTLLVVEISGHLYDSTNGNNYIKVVL